MNLSKGCYFDTSFVCKWYNYAHSWLKYFKHSTCCMIVHINSCTILLKCIFNMISWLHVSVFTEWKYVSTDEKLMHGVTTCFYHLEPMWAHLNIKDLCKFKNLHTHKPLHIVHWFRFWQKFLYTGMMTSAYIHKPDRNAFVSLHCWLYLLIILWTLWKHPTHVCISDFWHFDIKFLTVYTDLWKRR